MKLYLPIVLICLLGISSCTKKELPQPVAGDPTIWMQCKMNSFPFELNVGKNATYASSISYVDKNLRQFVFTINAPDLKKSFQISINNYNDSVGTLDNDLDQTIKPGKYNFTYTNSFPYFVFRTKDVNIIYTDYSKGQNYYSMSAYQASSAEFEIVSVKDVVEDGKRYKLAEIKFSCMVAYDDQSVLWTYVVTDGHCVIPFGG